MPFAELQAFLLGPSSPDQSLDRESNSGYLLTEEDVHVVNRQPQNVDVTNSWSDMYGHAQQHANCQQQGLPENTLPLDGGILNQVMQPDFVGHNIACAPNQYYDGMMSTYDPPMIPPEFLGVPTRILLTPETGPRPVYVNAKQYGAILRRRQSRAKEDARKKLIKNQKSYLHESRHQHALTRARSFGGRFARRPEAVWLNNTTASGSSNRSRSLEPSEIPRGESVNL